MLLNLMEDERRRMVPASTLGIWAPGGPQPRMQPAQAGGGDMAALASLAPLLFGGAGGSSSTTAATAPAMSAPASTPAPAASAPQANQGGGFMANLGRGLKNIDAQTWFDIIGGFADPDSYVGAGARGISQALGNQKARNQQQVERARIERAVKGATERGSTGEDPLDPEVLALARDLPADQALQLITDAIKNRQTIRAQRAQADYVSPYRRERDKIEDDRADARDKRAERADSRAAAASARAARGGLSPDGSIPGYPNLEPY